MTISPRGLLSFFLVALVLGSLLAPLTGCTATKRRVYGRTVPVANIESVIPPRPPVNAPPSKVAPLFGVIIENASGSVTVIADPKATVPEVRAKVFGTDEREARRAGVAPAWIAASIEKYDNINTLQVLAADPSEKKRSVDLRVVVPATAFVTVNNAMGNVELIGIAGNLQINNGVATGKGGKVIVRTENALKDGAAIRVRSGDVWLSFGSGSAGAIDAKARSVNIRTPLNAARGVVSDNENYQGELGSLGKPMTFRVPDGSLTLFVD
jgi:hypothetical protein